MVTVFKNGRIYTMNREMPYVSAVVVRDDRIAYVGTDAGAAAYEADAKVIDLNSKMMIPGMIDAHCHPMQYPFLTSGILLDVTMNREEMLTAIAGYVNEHPEKNSYFGIGYPEWVFGEKGPQKSDLDAICAEKPIFLMSSGIHEGWCNSKTLELLHVTKDTPDMIPGFSFFQRDENGKPTGRVVEIPSEMMILKGIQWINVDEAERLYRDYFNECSSLGITGFVDCGNFEAFEPMTEAVIQTLLARGEMKQRVNGCVMVEDPEALESAVTRLREKHAQFHSDFYDVRTLKIVNDGTVESVSACTYEPFGDGTLVEQPMAYGQKFYDACVDAAKAGFDIHIHGIGDKTIHENLMAAKAVREAGYYDTRFINAHTQLVKPEDIPLFGKYNVLANLSSIWFYTAPDVTRILGEERVNRQYQVVSIMKEGGRITLGSDMPADELGHEPLKGIQMAVTRKLYLEPEAESLAEDFEKMTVHEALEAYTINPAYGMHWDDRIGSLEVGKYADLVILEKDLNEVAPDEIMNTKILLTMVGGKVTYMDDEIQKYC